MTILLDSRESMNFRITCRIIVTVKLYMYRKLTVFTVYILIFDLKLRTALVMILITCVRYLIVSSDSGGKRMFTFAYTGVYWKLISGLW